MRIQNVVTQGQGQRYEARAAYNAHNPEDPTTRTELAASLLREKELLQEINVLSQRQDLMAQEFEHRLGNSLQMIVSLLSLQSIAAPKVEAAKQLTVAAGRVAAFGRVHRRLHQLDHQKNVELKQFLHGLCSDLSGLLLQKDAGRAVIVTGGGVTLPTALGIPLGFLVSEAVTNSVKHAKGNIVVRIEASASGVSLSIIDEGPGLPPRFDPARSKGLGMKLVQSLATQIGGTLQFAPGDDQSGTRLTVTFTA